MTSDHGKKPPWVAGLNRFEKPSTRKVAIQLADTVRGRES